MANRTWWGPMSEEAKRIVIALISLGLGWFLQSKLDWSIWATIPAVMLLFMALHSIAGIKILWWDRD